MDAMLYQRNIAIVEKIKHYLDQDYSDQNRDAFVVTGYLHLLFKQGIIDLLLAHQEYKVERVPCYLPMQERIQVASSLINDMD